MRIMALDLGEKTVGVAVSDELEITANPRTVLRRDGTEIDRVLDLVREEGIGELIVGLPISMSGAPGPAAERVRAFVAELAPRVPIPVRTWDERLSTREAERAMIAADVRRARRRQVIDQMAAAVILEGYLRYRTLRRPDGEEEG
jgi:putative Holliday junction resolvase